MLVMQGATPEETKASIVEYLKLQASRYLADSRSARLKIDQACDRARGNALLNAAMTLEHAAIADFKKKEA